MKPHITIITLEVEDLQKLIYFKDPDGFYWEVAHNPFM